LRPLTVICTATFSGQLFDALTHIIFDMSNMLSGDVIQKRRWTNGYEKGNHEALIVILESVECDSESEIASMALHGILKN
jgi:hypothetical protein